jgi:SlyX protein
MSNITDLEERIAYLTRTVDDLSDIVARQENAISVLQSRMEMVMRREAQREAGEGGGAVLTDERPPHW